MGIISCVALLKPGAPLLLYLYYAFDNRGKSYRALRRFSGCLQVNNSIPTASKTGSNRNYCEIVSLVSCSFKRCA